MTLFGEEFDTPIMTAALSHLHNPADGMAVYAKGVSVGRHLMPLLKDGADAVAARISEMTAELAGIMARTGVKSLDEMDPTVIHRRTF